MAGAPPHIPFTTSNYCARYDGVKVYGRLLGIRAEFATLVGTATPEQRGWVAHTHIGGMYTHAEFPDHAVLQGEYAEDWTVLQRCKGRADIGMLEDAARQALGEQLLPGGRSLFPRALRVPLRQMAGSQVELPPEPCRCRSIAESRHVRVLGVDIELRLSATNAPPREPHFYAEAFVGSHHNCEGKPRSLLFLADVRRGIPESKPAWLAKFVAQLLDELFKWIDCLSAIGLEPDGKAKGTPPIMATAHHVPVLDDVVFDVDLPSLTGKQRFVAHWVGWSASIMSSADARAAAKCMSANPDMLGSRVALYSNGTSGGGA